MATNYFQDPFGAADYLAEGTRGVLSTAGKDISMFMDDKEIARLKRLLGDQ